MCDGQEMFSRTYSEHTDIIANQARKMVSLIDIDRHSFHKTVVRTVTAVFELCMK